VILVLALFMVFLAPFALMVLGGVGVVLLIGLWLKTAVRARKLVAPFTPAEGALALSSLFLIVGAATVSGLMVARLGLGHAVSLGGAMLPMMSGGPPRAGDRSVYFSDSATRQHLKDGLTKAGVPFRVSTREGKEYVSWSQEHGGAAEKALEEAKSAGPANDPSSTHRSVSFGAADTQKDFVAWLAKRGVKSEIVRNDGKDYVNWRDSAPISEIMEAFLSERSTNCKGAKAKAKC
jgi:hypothetical protein